MLLNDFVLLQEAPRGHPGGTQKAGLPQASDDCSGTAPAQLRGSARGTNLGRSQELGQHRENPISVNTVWGMTIFSYLRIAG